MALDKNVLKQSLYDGLYSIFVSQSEKAASGEESEDPKNVIKEISNKMASVISDAVDSYIRTGDVYVGPENISVTSPSGQCGVTPLSPSKIK